MTGLTRRAMGTSTLALMAAYAVRSAMDASAQTAHGAPALGSFGIDLTGRDLSVKPGDDFNRYCNGTWMHATQIPADRTSWGAFDMLRAKSESFFLAWGQVWRFLIRDGALRSLVLSNPHSPPQYRINGVVRNNSAWYAAFNVQPGDALFLAPEQRVTIW